MKLADYDAVTTAPRAALFFYQRDDGAILSVWNRRHHVWGLPGGKVEEGETLERALARELSEETGLSVDMPWSKIQHIYVSPTYTGSGRMCHVFKATGIFGYPIVGWNGEKNGGLGWMSREFLCSQERYSVGQWYQTFLDAISVQRGG